MRNQGGRRVAAIGIDAAEWSQVESFAREGLLPNIDKHLGSSALLRLDDEPPYRAEATWTEFLTGRTPGENAYWSTAVFDPENYEMWEVGAHTGIPFYARPDLRSIIFDVPHSHITSEARGAQVTAWGAHSPQYPTASSPRDLVSRIDKRFGVHRAVQSDSWDGWHNDQYGAALTDGMLDGLERKAQICPWLLEEFPDWQLFVTVLSETHTAGHQFLHGVSPLHPLHGTPGARVAADRLRSVYAKIDEVVGRLVDLFDDEDTTVVLFAVHGMWENGSDTAAVLLSELIHRRAFGRPFIDFPQWRDGMPLVELRPEMTPLEHLLRMLREPKGTMYGTRKERVVSRLAWELRRRAPAAALPAIESAWRRLNGTTDRWWELDVRAPASTSVDLAAACARRPCDYHVPSWYCASWPRLPYFVIPSFSDVHIRVNLKGRERDGVVEQGDYERVLDEIDVLLRNVVNARTGEPVVRDTYRVRAENPLDPDGPTADVVVTFGAVADAIRHPDVGVIGPCPIFRSGEHSESGWAAFRVPGGPVEPIGTGRPRDLASTVCELLALSPSPLLTGSSYAKFLLE